MGKNTFSKNLVSIHAPHEGERHTRKRVTCVPDAFQSTLPTRGSDGGERLLWPTAKLFQSTLPTRGSDGPNSSIVAV